MKKIFNGEVFFVLFLFSGVYKTVMSEFPVDPTALFLALSMVCGFWRVIRRGTIDSSLVAPTLTYVGIVVLALFSLLFVADNSYSYDKTIKMAIITGWSFLGPSALMNYSNPKETLNRIFGAITVVGLIAGIYVISGGSANTQVGFAGVGEGSYLALGRLMGASSIVLFAYFFYKKKTKRLIVLLALILSVYTLILSGGRMPVIAFVIAAIAVLMFGIQFKRVNVLEARINKKVLAFGFVFVWIAPYLYRLIDESTFYKRFLSLFELSTGQVENNRLYFFSSAKDMITESYMMGKGIGSFRDYIGIAAERAYPHNIFLEFFSELGIVGITLFITLIVLGFVRYFKSKKETNFYSVVIPAIFIFFFINAQTTGDINDNRYLFFTISLLNLSAVISKGSVASENQELISQTEATIPKQKTSRRLVL